MPDYDDSLVVTPEYMLEIRIGLVGTSIYSRRVKDVVQRVPVREGLIEIAAGDYPLDRFGSVIIHDIEDDYSQVTLTFDGENIMLPPYKHVTVTRIFEEKDPGYLKPPVNISARNKRWFGDYIHPPVPQLEKIVAKFLIRRVFEDRYREAYFYLMRARAGDAEAQVIMSKLLYRGDGIRKSRKEAREWLEKAKSAYDEDEIRQAGWWV
ncbi:MAG: hypothetical protein FWH02_05550 [Oscillospiraceae bacterium]|nr:hypothetical protein [Oscillospiraceae bacterium]